MFITFVKYDETNSLANQKSIKKLLNYIKMKKTGYIKKGLLGVTFVTTILLIASCGFNQKPKDSRDIAQDRNEATFDSNNQNRDAQFIVNAAEINMAQIQLGQLAQQRGQTTHVKELGKMMEDMYTKSQRDLTALANSKRITIPTTTTDDVRTAYEELNDKSGTDFDKAYADLMVHRHQDAIKTFEDATTERYDRDINDWAIATLPDLRKNLNHSLDIQTKNDQLRAK
jgi:putative membrane protein